MPQRIEIRFEAPSSGIREKPDEPLVEDEHLERFREDVAGLLGELEAMRTLTEDERRERLRRVHHAITRLAVGGLRLEVEEWDRSDGPPEPSESAEFSIGAGLKREDLLRWGSDEVTESLES